MGKGHWSGTVAHSNMAHHGGKHEGAGELGFGSGPGKAAMKTKVSQDVTGIDSNSGKNKVKVNTGKPYRQE